ncbi:hypothetical protein Q8F55_006174 [Vanrija albida]|uniref:MARVEL domain-containing protein n=1 Tax=Vanrija albida TaxID=181172 RepID=A0ABR3PWC2_9TREE
MSTYPVYYGAPAPPRPRSALSSAYRGVTVALGVIAALASVGYGLYLIIVQIKLLVEVGVYPTARTILGVTWPFLVAVLLIAIMAPMGVTAAVFAAKRKPSRPWMWVTSLVSTILAIVLNLAIRGGYWSLTTCARFNTCRSTIITRVWAPAAGLAAATLVFGVYFTVFFKKNIPDPSTAALAQQNALQQQPLMAQPYAYGAYGAYAAPQPPSTRMRTPSRTRATRGVDEDKDSVKENNAGYGAGR